ncbi:hypothetical protein CK203_038950 [Vitis vinifera]|uniref:Uncharacterized protein n=1 Tax=Vitis vinifera TaxID=29760 RepID=A0A438HG15_VITVI|nr:hypothetical protein CK203_038950 [Vitis vinifera]
MGLSVANLDLFKEPAFDCDETPPRLLRKTKASPFDVHLVFGNFRTAELQLVTATLAQAQEQLEELRKQTEIVQFLENELMAKSVFIETLQFELKEANELPRKRELRISRLEMELNQLKIKLKNANEERKENEAQVEIAPLKSELHKGRSRIAAAEAAEARAESVNKAKKADQIPVLSSENSSQLATFENRDKAEVLKELEFAMVRIAELGLGQSRQ